MIQTMYNVSPNCGLKPIDYINGDIFKNGLECWANEIITNVENDGVFNFNDLDHYIMHDLDCFFWHNSITNINEFMDECLNYVKNMVEYKKWNTKCKISKIDKDFE